jgi:hypothetical protein
VEKQEVYERFKREVDEWWNKLQQTQIQKSRTLQSRKGVEKAIVLRALDKFLPQLSAKERLEMETGQSISDVLWNVLVGIDRDYLYQELRAMCKKNCLPLKGHKKLLAWRLLRYEFENGEVI